MIGLTDAFSIWIRKQWKEIRNCSWMQFKMFLEHASEHNGWLRNFHYHKPHNSDYFSYRVAAISRKKYLIYVINLAMILKSGLRTLIFSGPQVWVYDAGFETWRSRVNEGNGPYCSTCWREFHHYLNKYCFLTKYFALWDISEKRNTPSSGQKNKFGTKQAEAASSHFLSSARFLLGLFFDTESGGDIFLRNVVSLRNTLWYKLEYCALL
jgi:hypothetical protein